MPRDAERSQSTFFGRLSPDRKVRYHAKSRIGIYRSKMYPVLKQNFRVFPALDWLAALTAHLPSPGEQVVRY